MPRKVKAEKPLTLKERTDWEAFCDDIDGKYEPNDPQDINVAQQVNIYIKLFGLEAADNADFRVQCSHFEDDKEDWRDVARIIRDRQVEMAKRSK